MAQCPWGESGVLTRVRVSFGDHQLDIERRILERSGQRIELQDKAFDVLAYLIEHRERFVSQEELLDALWLGINVSPAALSKAVQKARQAVGDDGEHQAVIHTQHGRGFRFVAELTGLAEPERKAAPAVTRSRTRSIVAAGALALSVVAVAAWLLHRATPEPLPVSGHSLAVLPFVNMSADPDQEYFAEGVSEELLNTVARFEGLRVVGRTSSFSFKGSDADLTTIGKALGADVILEGSVRTANGRVRITAQLLDAANGFHRWSETYDRELTDILAIQTEIAAAIADALRVNLSAEERERLAPRPTQNFEAYQAYLLGKRRLAEGTMSTVAAAIAYFEQAIDLDPKFALAYVGLADSFLWQDIIGPPTADMTARAHAAVNQALELDGQLGEAQAALGYVRFIDNDFAGAEAAFQRAATLAPNSSRVYREHAHLLRDECRFEEALTLAQTAVELDPLSLAAIQGVGSALVALGRFDEGLAWFERGLEIDPDHAETYNSVAAYHWMVTGRLDEAMVSLRKGLAIDPNPANFAILGWLYLELGDFDQAEHWISRAHEMGPESYYPIAAMQALALHRGDDAAALRYGTKAYEIWPQYLLALTFLRDRDVRLGRYAEARARYEEQYPELLNDGDPGVDRHNVWPAVDLALILARSGDLEQAELLYERSLQLLQSMPRLGWAGYEIIDAQIHAQRGEKQKALSAIRQAVDEGWRVGWWRWLRHKPDLESLYDEPEYQAMVAEIEADMVAQLSRVREMERNGELEPIPEASAASQ